MILSSRNIPTATTLEASGTAICGALILRCPTAILCHNIKSSIDRSRGFVVPEKSCRELSRARRLDHHPLSTSDHSHHSEQPRRPHYSRPASARLVRPCPAVTVLRTATPDCTASGSSSTPPLGNICDYVCWLDPAVQSSMAPQLLDVHLAIQAIQVVASRYICCCI